MKKYMEEFKNYLEELGIVIKPIDYKRFEVEKGDIDSISSKEEYLGLRHIEGYSYFRNLEEEIYELIAPIELVLSMEEKEL